MQLTERLWKLRVPLIVLIVVLVAFSAGRLYLTRGPGEAQTVNKSSLALASPEDSAVYSAAKAFVNALVSGEQEQVMEMLTDSHRTNWMESSFLYGNQVREKYDKIEVKNVRCGIVRYVQIAELGNVTTALVTVNYIVELGNDAVEVSVKMQENLGLQQVGSNWLIAIDERKQVDEEK